MWSTFRRHVREFLPLIALCVLAAAVFGASSLLPHMTWLSGLIIGSVAAVLLVGIWLIRCTTSRLDHASWYEPDPDDRRETQARRDYRFTGLLHMVRDASSRPDAAADLHKLLTSTVADRLRTNHDVDMMADPHTAARIIGPDLTRYLRTSPHDQSQSLRTLKPLIDRIEEL